MDREVLTLKVNLILFIREKFCDGTIQQTKRIKTVFKKLFNIMLKNASGKTIYKRFIGEGTRGGRSSIL